MASVQLGSRWRPGHIERRDTEAGTFEAVNPHALTASEILVQRALLRPVRHAEIQRRIDAARLAERVGGARR